MKQRFFLDKTTKLELVEKEKKHYIKNRHKKQDILVNSLVKKKFLLESYFYL